MALALVTTPGCVVTEDLGPQDVPLSEAEATLQRSLCERLFRSCRCNQWSWYQSEGECDQDVSEAMAELDEALSLGLTYDPACMGEYVYLLDDLGCEPGSPEMFEECRTPCLLAHGSIPEGQPCELYGDWISDCAQGLVCYGTCSRPCGDPSQLAAEGESCFDRPCADGLVCDFDGGEVCRVAPGPGEACLQGQCAEGAFCEAADLLDPMSEQRCHAPRDLEQPCRGHGQCDSGYCPAGFCAVAPRSGESCAEAGVCARGLACIDGACGPADSLLCSVPVPNV